MIRLDSPAMLSKAVDLMSELVQEVRLKVNEFGMSVTAIDPANVAMVSFKLPRSIFSEFEVGDENLGINLDNLKKILKRCKPGSSLVMEKQENMLKLDIQDRIRRSFSLCLIEVEGEEKEMPNLEFSSVVEINSIDLIDSIEDCAVVADSCAFKISDGKFIIQAKGLNSARSAFSGDEAKIEAEDCKSKYSLEYLSKFIKASKLADKTTLKFAEDHPLRMDVKSNGMEISFILAPRVETED